jgi:hypothetical protein
MFKFFLVVTFQYGKMYYTVEWLKTQISVNNRLLTDRHAFNRTLKLN